MSLVAHDLKGAFTSVLGFSKIMALRLKKDNTPIEIQKMGSQLLSNAGRVFNLLDELLLWSEGQMGLQAKECCFFYLAVEIESCVALLFDTANIKGTRITVDVPDDLQVYADPSITKTIFRNLT